MLTRSVIYGVTINGERNVEFSYDDPNMQIFSSEDPRQVNSIWIHRFTWLKIRMIFFCSFKTRLNLICQTTTTLLWICRCRWRQRWINHIDTSITSTNKIRFRQYWRTGQYRNRLQSDNRFFSRKTWKWHSFFCAQRWYKAFACKFIQN